MKRWIAFLLAIGWLTACAQNSSVPTADDPNVLFLDNFSVGSTGPWQVEGDASGRTAVLDEQLIIEIDTPATLQFATLPEPIFSDFTLTVDARQIAGDVQGSYGILFRMQNAEQFYRFDITSSGMYVVERRSPDGSWTRFVNDWTETPAINQGLGAVNQLRVEAVGTAMHFYVNDVLVQQVSDNQYVAGTIALDAGTFGQTGLQVAFDNLVVKRP
ncbi:MAG: DUF1080 domain-containing protein [Ardenticatenaceae bacterium]|nr:DUF1080 domain-containing protein [Anaerolineales bacterium]MCB8921923.1 DUF1080 domain-containing protein [Ardenticatenaceae bacterium]MCB8989498.1 DUF1080 domain-containing protein [Ardenticatenaceae bacterium]MCB9003042.1 DUF1080 domain-containing protein [Ardenticatenaceae bacterium]